MIKKVDAHHAIIPTARSSQVKLTDNEAKVYTLIARQYLMQFCPDAVFRKCQIDLEIANGKFVAKARFLAEAGWRTLLGSKERDEENDGTPLPVVAKGDELLCEEGRGGGASDPAAAPLYRRHAAVGDDRDCPLRAG